VPVGTSSLLEFAKKNKNFPFEVGMRQLKTGDGDYKVLTIGAPQTNLVAHFESLIADRLQPRKQHNTSPCNRKAIRNSEQTPHNCSRYQDRSRSHKHARPSQAGPTATEPVEMTD